MRILKAIGVFLFWWAIVGIGLAIGEAMLFGRSHGIGSTIGFVGGIVFAIRSFRGKPKLQSSLKEAE